MNASREAVVILLAEDDEEDRRFIEQAFRKSLPRNRLFVVVDGEDLLDYLYRRGAYADPETSPRPGLILLDLNLPRMSGFEALQAIREDPRLRLIPVVALTVSQDETDILRSYDLGVNAFVTKPVTIEAMVKVLGAVGKFWLEIVRLPPDDPPRDEARGVWTRW